MKTTNIKAIKSGEEFTWGEVVKIHEIGAYSVVEFIDNARNKTLFHPYVEERDLHHSFLTLDEAIINAVAFNKCGINFHYAAHFFMKMIS